MNDSPNTNWGGITTDEIREVWGGQLQPIPEELIAPVVTPYTRRFLTKVGLPATDVLGVDFLFEGPLLSVASQEGRDYLVVTQARSNASFAVDVRTDQVVEYNQSAPGGTRFMNSDIAALIFFLGQMRKALSLEEIPAIQAAIDDVRTSVTIHDLAAMEDEAAWKLWLDDLESQIE
ncbi:SUKH-4 family immunity protein [Micromonospora sp. CPCC 206060]|uniref:SUKH-4 family immunity protein n=1 Tax=Micromonospora sp. CPCC 206060 TaxID=3122406 RepID=UPI002FF42896